MDHKSCRHPFYDPNMQALARELHLLTRALTNDIANLHSVMVSKAGAEVDCNPPLVNRHRISVLLFSSIVDTLKTPDTVSGVSDMMLVIPLESGRVLTFCPSAKNVRGTVAEQLNSTDPES